MRRARGHTHLRFPFFVFAARMWPLVNWLITHDEAEEVATVAVVVCGWHLQTHIDNSHSPTDRTALSRDANTMHINRPAAGAQRSNVVLNVWHSCLYYAHFFRPQLTMLESVNDIE
jgi:hypothetical protein